jgi:glycerophosphoryl diester phosphodiesterase
MANSPRQNTVCYVEMKTVRDKRSDSSLAAAVVEIIQRHSFHNRVIVISFNLRAIAAVKLLDPSIRTGALFGPRQRATKSARKIVANSLECGANEILLHHLIAKDRLLKQALEVNLNPVVWTVENPVWIARAQESGIHALMTNNPAKMMARLRGLTSATRRVAKKVAGGRSPRRPPGMREINWVAPRRGARSFAVNFTLT